MKPNNPLWHPFGVPPVEKPRAEGCLYLPNGRRLGYAEYGDPAGAVVLWFHGTPGARRQFPLVSRRAAERLGLRVVVVERPGSGLSDPHRYGAIADWATDMAAVADALGATRLGVVGLSAGGPYALACGAVLPLAAHVAAVVVLDGIVPSVGSEVTASGFSDVARRLAPILSQLRRPLAVLATGLLTPLIPFAHYGYLAYSAVLPEGDQRVLADREAEAMFVDDVVLSVRGGCRSPIDDLRLFGRGWGFRLADVKVPVRWWHGEADALVPISAAQAAVSHMPDAELILRPGDSHLGGFAKVNEVLEFIRSCL